MIYKDFHFQKSDTSEILYVLFLAIFYPK